MPTIIIFYRIFVYKYHDNNKCYVHACFFKNVCHLVHSGQHEGSTGGLSAGGLISGVASGGLTSEGTASEG